MPNAASLLPSGAWAGGCRPGIRSYADHTLIGEAVRGMGLIGAVEVVRNKATKDKFDAKAEVAARAQQHGAILRDMPGDIVAFSPPHHHRSTDR